MLKIGLIAHRKGPSIDTAKSAYKVLYTMQDIKIHNNIPGNFPVQEGQLHIAQMLSRNNTFQHAIEDFRKQFGYVDRDQDRLAVYQRKYLDSDAYYNMQKAQGIKPLKHSMAMEQYLMGFYHKYQIVFDGKKMAGEFMLPLFFAGILDTSNYWHTWTNAPITHFLDHGLNINIRYNNVKKNTIVNYVERHWKELKEDIQALPSKGEYNVSERDWQIYELREKGITYSKIADKLSANNPDPDGAIDEAVVKTAYQRVCKKIDSVFVLVNTMKKPGKTRKTKHKVR